MGALGIIGSVMLFDFAVDVCINCVAIVRAIFIIIGITGGKTCIVIVGRNAIIEVILLPFALIVEGKSRNSGCFIGFVTGAVSGSIFELSPLFGKSKCKGGGGFRVFGENAVITSHFQLLALFVGGKRSSSPIFGPWTLLTGAEST